ncbi:hypothetical protein BCR34DRAFT_9824 [Clohesyomyces aquaticus]|uniref:F-box domain-containing protein n=1 Tax=Clohesyomyces aquaticus TaxID=1231657 RepID=A0A1Y2A5L4_9PLEO|nr:hypothetical protein BCR34DRAFT_9824 [Clohesyomyces aquaticus]
MSRYPTSAPLCASVTSQDQTRTILTLPLELREQIYKEVLTNHLQGPELLRSCREIYDEAHKFLFQRPLLLRNLPALQRWLDQAPERHFPNVIEVILELPDVDLTRLLTSPSSSHTPSSPQVSVRDLYEQELEGLYRGLKKLEQAKTLTIKTLPDSQSFLYRDFVAKFLDRLGSVFPGLQHLTLEGNFHHQSLSFLSSIKELRHLSFDGYSSTSPTATAEILAGLPHLTSLSLFSHPALLTPTDHVHSSFTSNRQSVTGSVLRFMNPLGSLYLTETMRPASSTGIFFTPEILSALHFSHNTSLTSLSICLSQVPDVEPLEALQEFLEGSSIRTLQLDWPNFDPEDMDDLLPGGLAELWVRTESKEKAFDVLYQVIKSKEAGEMGGLNRVVLMRKEWHGEGNGREEDVGERRSEDMDGSVQPQAGGEGGHGVSASDEAATEKHSSSGGEEEPLHDFPSGISYEDVARAMRTLSHLGVKASWYTESV